MYRAPYIVEVQMGRKIRGVDPGPVVGCVYDRAAPGRHRDAPSWSNGCIRGPYLGPWANIEVASTQRNATGARDQKLQQKAMGAWDGRVRRARLQRSIAGISRIHHRAVAAAGGGGGGGGRRRTELVARHDALLAKARAKTVMSYGASCILHEEKRAIGHGDQPSID